MLIPLIFLVLSCAFIATLFIALFKTFAEDWGDGTNMGKRLLNLYKWPILIFIAFLIFVMVILPRMEGNGYN